MPEGTRPRFVTFIAEPVEPDHPALAVLRDLGEVRLGNPTRRYAEDELAAALRDCDAVLITSRDAVTRAIIERAPKLKVICKLGARPDHVDYQAAGERGIRVLATPGSNADSVAEHAILLAMAVLRRLGQTCAHLKAGGWRDGVPLTFELTGKTVGLIGVGLVGGKVAEKLRGFRVRLLGLDPYVSALRAAELGVELVDLEALLAAADVVSLHATLTPQTRHLIGEPQLRRMRPTAVLVNTARGALVDEAALIRALQEGWIAGAGLDVFEQEPLPASSPLAAMDHVVATPHSAAYTRETMDREMAWAVEDVRRVLLGQEPLRS
ncbi:MAG: 3-phosphoglycerate dehydrogenase [Chloroflexi bacterium]|nr:3-phosphoglycerate dehydrogenase [Chloroflexota bacterium]